MKSIDPQVLGTSALDWIVVQHSCEMVAVQRIFDLFWYDHDDVNDGDDSDEEELLEIIMRRVCCVQCGVVCTPDYLRINQIMPHAMLKWIPMIVMMVITTNFDDDDDKSPTYCPERHSYRQRRSHIEGSSSRGRHTLKEILLWNYVL